jgi:hypothetical protein
MNMLRDKYPADPLFMKILELTGITIDAELVEIDRILEDEEIFQHHPTDSSLLADGVRVLSRLVKRAKTVVQDTAQLTAEAFCDRNRSARNAARRIYEATRRRGEVAKVNVQKAYRRLVRTTQASVGQAKQVLVALEDYKDRS